MTALNKQALREAAEKATAGQWVVELGDEVYAVDGDDSEQIAMVFSDNGRSDAAFIAAASPTTMLALLDELEAAEKRIAELEARDINIKRQAQALFEAIANPNDCYIPAYVRCLREALNGNSTGIGVKGE
ncbi:ead/Ea22-like family protein [Citrobacter youngae]|uniref:ead/Ea22-like family protein n=1 Tax=Citrobacter TaxID=544 RepID=UPI0015FD9C7C|nr:ead/Ea22-like family protein [Citrobacter sp. RHBSTW-00029]MBA8106181.1 ead/Ea22-like family protein [Citrobacter sp. RHBSTW-00029]